MTDNTQQARAAVTPEAIEAAARMSQALHFAEPWESLSDFLRSERLREANLIIEAAAPFIAADASAEVARAFANKEAAKRVLVAGALGIDPEVAARLGYGMEEQA